MCYFCHDLGLVITENIVRPIRVLNHPAAQRCQLIADSAYELCTPISFIQSCIEMMEEGVYQLDADGLVALSVESRTDVLKPYFRADKSRSRDSGGADLGLSICREIARVYGGNIEAGSSKLIGAAKISLHLSKDVN